PAPPVDEPSAARGAHRRPAQRVAGAAARGRAGLRHRRPAVPAGGGPTFAGVRGAPPSAGSGRRTAATSRGRAVRPVGPPSAAGGGSGRSRRGGRWRRTATGDVAPGGSRG